MNEYDIKTNLIFSIKAESDEDAVAKFRQFMYAICGISVANHTIKDIGWTKPVISRVNE